MTDHPRFKAQRSVKHEGRLGSGSKTEHPDCYFKSATVDESQQFHPLLSRTEQQEGGVVLIEVCLDDISNQRVAKKFLSSLP